MSRCQPFQAVSVPSAQPGLCFFAPKDTAFPDQVDPQGWFPVRSHLSRCSYERQSERKMTDERGCRGRGVALAIRLTSFFFRTTWHGPPRPRQKLRRLLRGAGSQWPSSRPAHLSLPLDALATDALGPQRPSFAKVVRGQRQSLLPPIAPTREARPCQGAPARRAVLWSRSRCPGGAGEDAGAQGRGCSEGAR